jgi:hypothetical protein
VKKVKKLTVISLTFCLILNSTGCESPVNSARTRIQKQERVSHITSKTDTDTTIFKRSKEKGIVYTTFTILSLVAVIYTAAQMKPVKDIIIKTADNLIKHKQRQQHHNLAAKIPSPKTNSQPTETEHSDHSADIDLSDENTDSLILKISSPSVESSNITILPSASDEPGQIPPSSIESSRTTLLYSESSDEQPAETEQPPLNPKSDFTEYSDHSADTDLSDENTDSLIPKISPPSAESSNITILPSAPDEPGQTPPSPSESNRTTLPYSESSDEPTSRN